MKPLKTSLVLLLALVLVGLCALLPRGVSYFLDQSAIGELGATKIQSVELSLFGSTTPYDQLDRLAMVQNMSGILISPEQASMTTDEVEAQALYTMDYFYSLGLMERKDMTMIAAEPRLVVDQDDISKFLICWDVVLSVNKGLTTFQVLIDDETGKAFQCSYATDVFIFPSNEEREAALNQFAPAFWTQLGIMDRINSGDLDLRSHSSEKSNNDQFLMVENWLYPSEDSQDPILSMGFAVNPDGFYTFSWTEGQR